MASLSVEQENYVRMSLLLTGISSRAARNFFDSLFAPACLDATIRKEHNKLLYLKKQHRINQSQWNLLCPRFPDVPDSKTFDVTLMILLLRYLTPLSGFDRLPSAKETTPVSDLARIKHYRNHLAHLDDGKLDPGFFITAWNDITGAIDRLGGHQMKQECDHLKTKPLDQTNHEIIMEIKHSNNEIRELKASLISLKTSYTKMIKSHDMLQEDHDMLQEDYTEVKISHEKSHQKLQDDHTKVKKSLEILQDDHRKVTKEMEEIKTSQEDTVPWNIRARINDTFKDWKDHDDKMFIDTRAAQYVLECIKGNSCVTITASSGVGKTATLRHVALQMAKEGYDVLMVTEPGDIPRFNNPNKRTLFVVDDLCGNFSLDQSDIKRWEPVIEDIKQNLAKNKTKILAACRLQVYQDEKFDSLSVFKSCVCNMISKNMCLSKTEKEAIAKLYLNAKASEIGELSDIYDCFPLLCKLYHDNPKLAITDFFQNPFSIYEAEIDKLLKKGHYAKYCALALCVMFNNKLKEEMLTEKLNEETSVIIEDTFQACKLDRGTSRLVLQDELDSLEDTFIKKENNIYKILHDKIFDFLVKIYGQKIIYCLIRNADIGLIKERFLLERKDDMDQFITIIPTKHHQIYIQRMIDDWSKGKLQGVFSNINMKMHQFKKKLLCCLNTLDISNKRRLANMSVDDHDNVLDNNDEDDVSETALLHCCYIGNISLVKWCCDHGVNINRCTHDKLSPLMIACEHGHTEIAKMLLDRGVDYNKCDNYGESPVMKACEHGHTEIVMILLKRGADYNKCDAFGHPLIIYACKYGHIEIVKILLDTKTNYNKRDTNGASSLMMACAHGHTEIVKMLLDKGADYNNWDINDMSPVMYACQYGHTEIVKILLDKGADYSKCNLNGWSSVMMACGLGHTEIVKILLDKGADCNILDRNDESSLTKACKYGHTEIVKILLDKGADYSKCNLNGWSSVMMACGLGHTEIVKILLDRGADCNILDRNDESPLLKACELGLTEIVNILLDSGADYDKGDSSGKSPVIKACENGHTEIVKMLLDKGADCTSRNLMVQLALKTAVLRGHKDTVALINQHFSQAQI